MYSEQKLAELFKSDTFKAEVANVKTAADLQEAFARNDVEMTQNEVLDLCGEIAQQMESNEGGELTEENLENVSGGIAWTLIGLGVVCLGSAALGIWNGYQKAKRDD